MMNKNIFPQENRFFETEKGILYNADTLTVLKAMQDSTVDCIITSPPYYKLRNYNCDGQIGVEETVEDYIQKLINIFREVKRVLRKDGSLYVNIDDTYNGNKKVNDDAMRDKKMLEMKVGETNKKKQKRVMNKSLLCVPFLFAEKMVYEVGYCLRNTIVWIKPNQMPIGVQDRYVNDFEYMFFFTKSDKYYFERQYEDISDVTRKEYYARKENERYHSNLQSKYNRVSNGKKMSKGIVKKRRKDLIDIVNGRIKRTSWHINTQSNLSVLHFASFPENLVVTPLRASCRPNGIVMDVFMGTGTVGYVAEKLSLNWIGIDLSKEYCEIAKKRIEQESKQLKMF